MNTSSNIPTQEGVREGTVNLIFSSMDELLTNFQKSYVGPGEFHRVPGRHPYSSVLEQADPSIKGTIVYLVETDDSPEGMMFSKLEKDVILKILDSYDTVLQIFRVSFDGGKIADGVAEHKVYGYINSQF
jgi:hypothetical protein